MKNWFKMAMRKVKCVIFRVPKTEVLVNCFEDKFPTIPNPTQYACNIMGDTREDIWQNKIHGKQRIEISDERPKFICTRDKNDEFSKSPKEMLATINVYLRQNGMEPLDSSILESFGDNNEVDGKKEK